MRDTLISYGVKPENIRDCAKTGLVVDIHNSKGPVKYIAIRTDMDGLPMPENNPHLEYRSRTKWAHMCGHDGHMAMVLAMAEVVAKR